MLKNTTQITILFLLIFSIYACGGESDKKQTSLDNVKTVEKEVIEENTDQTEYVLPSPLQIAELFKRAGLNYIGDLTSPKEKASNYNSKYDLELNFGIYSADMAYCVMNNQTQASIDYLSTLKDLSEKLWMTDILNSMGLSQRLEANIGNEDSLVYIMADLQMQIDNYLDDNRMGHIGSIIFAGAWVETMYLGAKENELEKNEKLISKISEQATILNSLIASIKQNNKENEFTELIAELDNINKNFTSFNDEDPEEFILSDEAIKGLTADIISLRTKIIGE